METKNLVKVSTYAKIKNKSVECIRVWVRKGKIKPILIDGVLFIEIDK